MKREMKKSYLTLAAMAMIMASCSNEVLVDDSEKSGATDVAIGFSTFSDKATKAQTKPVGSDYFLEDYHESFKVFGTKTDAENNVQYVFNGVVTDYVETESKRDATGEWHYAPARYWDKQAKNYKFLAFAPAHAPLKYTRADDSEIDATGNKFTANGKLTLNGTNLMQYATSTTLKNVGFTGLDVKYTQEEANLENAKHLVADTSAKNPGEDGYTETFESGYTKVTEESIKNNPADCDVMITPAVSPIYNVTANMDPVDLIFGHTLSKLTVSLKKSSDNVDVKVSNVEAKGFYNVGSFDINSWTAETSATSTKCDYIYDTPNNVALDKTDVTYFIESLVMPQNITSDQTIKVKYSVTSKDPSDPSKTYTEDFVYTVKLSDIYKVGKADQIADKYNGNTVYNVVFTINPEANVIKFDAGASEWATNVNGAYTIE